MAILVQTGKHYCGGGRRPHLFSSSLSRRNLELVVLGGKMYGCSTTYVVWFLSKGFKLLPCCCGLLICHLYFFLDSCLLINGYLLLARTLHLSPDPFKHLRTIYYLAAAENFTRPESRANRLAGLPPGLFWGTVLAAHRAQCRRL